ncbi:MAG: hypothetical protein KZY61_09365 [Clostridiaceae bacterium]|nr:hypothetical protein [Clostridiaceae bacterium]MBW4858483.1 hypothetical protein [Clostridiaceae bacterium]MBW4868856.1 hypothetical protein [Clostridiaceae bacterium]
MSLDNEQYTEYTDCGRCDGEDTNTVGEFVVGNVTEEIEISKDIEFSELRADITVKKERTLRVWGQVKDCNGKPVKNALLKLVKEVKDGSGRVKYVGIAHGITDCLGFYQFDVCIPKGCTPIVYRIFASKQALGKEGYIKENECDPCLEKFICAE